MTKPPANFATYLGDQGYWIFPSLGFRKGAGAVVIDGQEMDWGDVPRTPSMRDKLAAQAHGRVMNRTGFSVLLQKTDPVPLCIVDFDPKDPKTAALSVDELWSLLFGEPVAAPSGLGVVRTPNGGTHFYMRVPRSCEPKVLVKQGMSLIEGLPIDTRVSGGTDTLLMLPGTRVKANDGKAREYDLIQFPERLEDLAEVPERFIARMHARVEFKAVEDAATPTEIEHLLAALALIPAVPPGQQNDTIARIGQVVGRLDLPWDALPPNITDQFADLMLPKLEGAERAWFKKSFLSGYKKGRSNAKKHGLAAKKRPIIRDVLDEVRILFGGDLWIKELITSTNRTEGYVIGVGGSLKDPEGSKATIEVKSFAELDEVFAQLVNATDASEEDLYASPLWLNQGYQRLLRQHLRTSRRREYLGMTIKETLQFSIEETVMDIFQEGGRVHRSFPSIKNDSPSFIFAPQGQVSKAVACFPKHEASILMQSCGDSMAGQRVFKTLAVRRTRNRATYYEVALSTLSRRAVTALSKTLREGLEDEVQQDT